MPYSDDIRDLWSVYSPILLVFGLLGNSLALVVTSRSAMRAIGSSRYLMAIAVADNGSLVFGLLPKWIQHRFGVDVTTFNDFLCKTRNFLFYTSQDASIWVVCSFTFDRFLVVVFPLRRAVVRATRRIRISIATVVLLAVLKNASIFWSRAVVTRTIQNGSGGRAGTAAEAAGSDSWGNETGSSTSYQRLCRYPTTLSANFENYVRPWIVFVTVHCLPFLLLVACNVAIVHQIVKVRYAPLRDSRRSGASGVSRGRVARMTGLCLAVSLTFLVLEFPSTVLLIGRPYWTSPPGETPKEQKHAAPRTSTTSRERPSLFQKGSVPDQRYTTLLGASIPIGRYQLSDAVVSTGEGSRLLAANSTLDREYSIPQGATPDSAQWYELLEAIASLLNYTNNAVNFYLYCLAGARFRKEFVSMVTRDKFRKHLSMKFNRSRAVNHREQHPVRRLTDADLTAARLVHRAYEDTELRELESQISRPRSSTM